MQNRPWHLHPRFALRESKRIIMKDSIHKTRGFGKLSEVFLRTFSSQKAQGGCLVGLPRWKASCKRTMLEYLESGIGPSFDRNMFQPTSLFFASFLGREGNTSYQLIPSKNCSVDKFAVLQSHLKTMTTFHLWFCSFLRFVCQVRRWDLVCQTSQQKTGMRSWETIRGQDLTP